jgi:hypothetical protein
MPNPPDVLIARHFTNLPGLCKVKSGKSITAQAVSRAAAFKGVNVLNPPACRGTKASDALEKL